MLTTKQVANKLKLAGGTVTAWCKLNNVQRNHRGWYMLNDLQVQEFVAHRQSVPFNRRRNEQHTMLKQFNLFETGVPVAVQPVKHPTSDEKIKKLELMLQIAKLEKQRDELQKQLNDEIH
jgi:hypothetical protein